MDDINPLYKAFKLAVGVLLSLVVAGYAVGVGMTGGFDNPAHPRSREELEMTLLKFMQQSQTTDELLQEIEKSNQEEKEWNAYIAQDIKRELDERIERQRIIAARRDDVPEDHRISFGKQLEADMEEGLSEKFPDLVDVHIKSVLMQEPDAYEAIGGSKATPGDLLKYLVTISKDQGYLVIEAMHHEGESTAFVFLYKEQRGLFAAMIGMDDVFENYPTVVYYGSVSDKYQADEIPAFVPSELFAEEEFEEEEW